MSRVINVYSLVLTLSFCFVFGCKSEIDIQPELGHSLDLKDPNTSIPEEISNSLTLLGQENHQKQSNKINIEAALSSSKLGGACPVTTHAFRVQYAYDPDEIECYEEDEMVEALVSAGMGEEAAIERTYRIFHTAYASPQILAQTAGILGPMITGDEEQPYVGFTFWFLGDGTCLEGCIPSPQPQTDLPFPGLDRDACHPGEIERVFYMSGNSGSFDAPLSNENVGASYQLQSICEPGFGAGDTYWMDMEAIRTLLGPVRWARLLFGNYTQREFWNLYHLVIVPALLQTGPDIAVGDPCLAMRAAFFNANYQYTYQGNTYYGYVIYNMRGSGQLYCDEYPNLPG